MFLGYKNINKNTKGSEAKYYSFPKNNILGQQWLQACYRKDKVNLKNATICSHHFREDVLKIKLSNNIY